MRMLHILAAAALVGGFATVALADSDEHRDAGPLSATAASSIRSLEQVGYRVGAVEAEHGRYEVRLVNDSGYPVKCTFDAATGELIAAELKRH